MIIIRPARTEEVADATAVINAAYVVEAFFKVHPDRTDAQEIAARVARGQVLVATEGDAIVGCVAITTEPPEGRFGMLSVAPEHQGRGIGRQLIEAAEARCAARGCDSLSIEVVHLRTELPAFYERFGYAVTGTAPFPVPEQLSQPVHFLILSKPLAATPAPVAQEAAPWAPASH